MNMVLEGPHSEHVVIPATQLKPGMYIDVLTLGRREIKTVVRGEEIITVTHESSDGSPGWRGVIRYPVDSDVEVVATGDGF